MTPTYYYTWEFVTSITIIILVIAYIVHDQIKQRREKDKTDTETKSDTKPPEKHHSA